MSTQLPFLCNGDDSFAVISACYTLTEQYRNILIDLGKEHQLSENEMLVLVYLAQYPEACTQKKLQGTHLQLSVSSICRMVDSLRKRITLLRVWRNEPSVLDYSSRGSRS